MPKLHDACQIFAEETLGHLKELSIPEAALALALVYHAMEDDLSRRHPEAEIISRHLWQVLEEIIQQEHPEFTHLAQGSSQSLPEDDLRLAWLIETALQSGRSLFPGNRAPQA